MLVYSGCYFRAKGELSSCVSLARSIKTNQKTNGCPLLRRLLGDVVFYSTLINCSTKRFRRKSINGFWFNRRFPESSLKKLQKELSIAFY